MQRALTKIDKIEKSVSDPADLTIYNDYKSDTDPQIIGIEKDIENPELIKNIRLTIVKKASQALILFVFKKESSGNYRLAGRADIQLRGNWDYYPVVFEPITVTYIKNEGLMDKAIDLLIMSKTLYQWESSSSHWGAQSMYDRKIQRYRENKSPVRVDGPSGGKYILSLDRNRPLSIAGDGWKDETPDSPGTPGASSGVGKTRAASAPGEANPYGGIDFDPSKLNLQIKRDGHGVPLPLPRQDLENINIKGLYPVILNILPVNPTTLPILSQFSVEPDVAFSKS